MNRREALREAGRRNLERKDTGLWAAQHWYADEWRVVRLITSGIGRRAGDQSAAASARPAVRPENRQPPRNVPSSAR